MRPALLYLLTVILAVGTGCAPQADAQEQADEAEPEILPDIDKLLRRTSEYLKAAGKFSFRAEIAYDEMEVADDEEGSDLKLQYGATVELTARKPDRMRLTFKGDQLDREFWYDGKTATLLAPHAKFYGRLAVPGSIDKALDAIQEKTGYAPPLSDLVYPDPYALLAPRIEDAYYVGLHTAAGVLCHHVLLVQETVDWQIWIQTGEQPLPRKLVITYKQVPGSPQYAAVFTKWDFAPAVPDSLFVFEAPPDAVQVEMVATRIPGAR